MSWPHYTLEIGATEEMEANREIMCHQLEDAFQAWHAVGNAEGTPEHVAIARAQIWWLAWTAWYAWEAVGVVWGRR